MMRPLGQKLVFFFLHHSGQFLTFWVDNLKIYFNHRRFKGANAPKNITFLPCSQNDGRLKLHKGGIIFKANKTGKIDQAAVADIESTSWLRVARGFELNVALTNGMQFKFEGFKEAVSLCLHLKLLES